MPIFQATIQHDDKTFETLAHMQYDLFCKSNRVARTILSIAAILFGVANYESWWGILVIAYGCYLTTSTYSSANHTAHKLANGIRNSGMQFPSSRYEFTDEGVQIISLPEQEELGEPLGYSTFEKLGEDWGYFYLFPNPHGGYMIPKTEIEDAEAFREFIRHKTGKTFQRKMPPVVKLLQKLKDREQEPYHL
jgi:hypothetical protein